MEWTEILDSLPRGAIFLLLANSECRADTKCKTTGVRVEYDGKVVFVYNPEFWAKCSFEERRFCVVHEAFHVLLEHWTRIKPNKESNMAADLVVNHLATNIYRIVSRKDIRFAHKLCWTDTVFRRHKVGVGESYEYYYSKLHSLPRVNVQSILDDHEFCIDKNGLDIVKERIRLAYSRGFESEEQIEDLDREVLDTFLTVPVDWSRVLKGVFSRYRPGKSEHWMYNRRLDEALNELSLPSEIENLSIPSVNACIFVDTSKSCNRFISGFMRSLKYVPKHIQVTVKGFCGKVYDIDKRVPKLYTGTTSYAIIEKALKKMPRYPDCVVVLTDGYGDAVLPKFPKRWNWVLVKRCTIYVPQESRTFFINVDGESCESIDQH